MICASGLGSCALPAADCANLTRTTSPLHARHRTTTSDLESAASAECPGRQCRRRPSAQRLPFSPPGATPKLTRHSENDYKHSIADVDSTGSHGESGPVLVPRHVGQLRQQANLSAISA